MEDFCQARSLPITSIYVSAPHDRDGSLPERQRVELMFGNVDDLKKAFKDKALTPNMRVGGSWVRVRPKAGTSSASVEWLLVLMEYLYESVPQRFWLRATLSCLISMSLTRTFVETVTQA